MKDIRLIKLMKAFSREELKAFGKFVESPFSKSSRNTIELYKCLVKFYPDFKSVPSNEEIFDELFKGESYNERRLQNLIFDLTNSAEYYLAHNTFEEDELEFLLSLSKGYLDKNLPGESKRINKEIEKKLVPTFSPNKDYVSKLKRLTYLKFQCNTNDKDYDSLHNCVENVFEASVIQFIFEYTIFIDNMKISSKDFGKKIENEFIKNVIQNFDFEKLLTVIEESDYMNNPSIGLHFYRFKTLTEEDNLEYYNLFKRLLLKNLSVLDREEKWFFFIHLLNYCEQKKLNKVKAFEKEALNIYKSIVENNAYSPFENQYIDLRLCRNLILNCVSLNDDQWLNYFLENYLDCVNPEDRVNMENFGYAHLYFMKGEFGKSLEHTSEINDEFFFFKTDIKNLLLRIYYELNYFEEAFHLIDSYKHFIASNNEMPEVFKTHYRNYVKLYTKLIKIKSGGSKEIPSIVKEEIQNNTQIVNKLWLLEKADELAEKVKSYDKAAQSF